MPLRFALLASAALMPAGGPAAAFTLHILHVNDFHSRIESINATGSTCSDEEEAAGECFGGAARLKTAVDARRDELLAKGENVLVLDAGDQFAGSLFFTTFQGQAEVEFMNRIGFDAMVFGNHEFDLGPGPLAAFVEKAEFPVIFGNVEAAGDNRLEPRSGDRGGGRRARRPRGRADAGDGRDILARADGQHQRPHRLSHRNGGSAGSGGREAYRRADPPRRARGLRRRRGRSGDRRDRGRAFTHRVFQHDRGRGLSLSGDGRGAGGRSCSGGAGGVLLHVPRPPDADL